VTFPNHYEVTVGLSLLREGLSEVEGEGVQRDSGSFLGRFFLLGRRGLRRRGGGLSTPLTFGRRGRNGRGSRRHRGGSNGGPSRGLRAVGTLHASQSCVEGAHQVPKVQDGSVTIIIRTIFTCLFLLFFVRHP